MYRPWMDLDALDRLFKLINPTSEEFKYFAAGAIGTGCLAKLLKRVIRQPRPHGQRGHGMPSSHSQVAAFCATFSHLQLDSVFLSISAAIVALSVLWSRVYFGYHTPIQVIVGGLFGVLIGLIWYTVMKHNIDDQS